MSLTIILVAVTVLTSIAAFNNSDLIYKFILWPRRMDNPKEWYRLLTSGFIHADWNHLLFNMFSLYFVGESAEMLLGGKFLVLYLTGIIAASLPSFFKNKYNSSFQSLGASGGVAAVLFLVIYFFPWAKVHILFIPIGIPAILFGVIYLAAEAYMSKRGGTNINHDAHFWGSMYGLLFALLVDPTHGSSFIYQLTHPGF